MLKRRERTQKQSVDRGLTAEWQFGAGRSGPSGYGIGTSGSGGSGLFKS